MRICNKVEEISVVSDIAVFITFVTLNIDGTERNFSEWLKIK